MRTVYPKGTTIYKPEKCYNGYTIFARGQKVKLIDMNGGTVNEWIADSKEIKGAIRRARLLKKGNVLVQRASMASETGGIQEYDWNNNLVWQYIPEGRIPHEKLLGPHHDVFRKPNGNILLICREAVPTEYKEKAIDPRRRNITLYSDVILEVTPNKDVVWEWHEYERFDINFYCAICNLADWTHTNTVQALPENRWYDAGDERFKPGNVMVSPRSLDTVYIIDKDTKEIVWNYMGDYMGGLSGQHEPHMIEKGLPGDGNILIFDNGASPWKDLGHAGHSYVLEINPVTKEIVWKYENGEQFHSAYTSSAQRLKNGNTLICEAAGSRIFEVTTEGEVAWEYVEGTTRAYRYPYDYCPKTSALGKPKEVSVTPPEEMRISPDVPIE